MADPIFNAPVTNPSGLTNVGYLAKPTFADIDGDGDLDAFVGNVDGNTLFYRNTGSASAPSFAAPVTNPFGLTDVGNFAAPSFADIDGDGDLDAFVGNLDGNTQFYRNIGSASAPSFAAPVTNPNGLTNVGNFAAPTFADIDGDGDLDAFVGEGDGNTLFYNNTGSASAPRFAAPVTNPNGLTDVGNYAAPTFADIDNDGDLDAFLGNFDGNTLFFRNTGSASAPSFAAPVTNPNGLTNVLGYAAPTLVDIDGDGDLDTFVGSYFGDTRFYRNTASDPGFAAPVTNPNGLTDVGAVATPTFADIDNDGDLDAFVGNYDGNTLFYRNTGSASAPRFAAPVTNPNLLTAVGFIAAPNFADIDGDGDLDAFVGNSDGNTLFYRNTGSTSVARFVAAPVTNPFGLTDVGSVAAATFADIDGDGDLDAFVGNSDGNTLFYRNTGSASAPSFAAAVTNPFGLTDVGFAATPTFADIDGDGDLDAFVGNRDGNTLFYRNTGSASAPSFAASITNPFGLTDVGYVAKPTFADIDGDGDLDAFVGNNLGNTLFFLNTASVTSVNSPPTATNDSNTTNEDTEVTGNVLTNDTDPNPGDILSVSAVNGVAASVGNQLTLASGALLTLTSNGTYDYNPNGKFESLGAGQTGSDSFTYSVSDGKGGTSKNATVTITITGVNDAPTGSPTATLAAGTEDTPYTITTASLLQGFTDVDGNTLSVSNLAATNGALVNNNNGTYTFTPNANYNGAVNLTYGVTDGTATSSGQTRRFSVTAVNDAPTGSPTATLAAGTEDTPYTITAASLLQGFTDVDGNTLSVSNLTATNGALVNNNNGTYTFTPTANYNGVVNLTYGVTDGTATSSGQTRSFSVTAVNDAPVAVNDTTTARQNTAVTITASSLLANDTDVDSPNSALRITRVSGATNGTVALNNNGTATNFADDFISFTPNNGFSGNASFNYTLSDGSLSSSATVQVVVGRNINGGNNNDNLTGTAGNDVINGLNGQDTLSGNAGNDRIDGGNGFDTLLGGNGQDQLWGDAGDDLLFGGRGNDTLAGGSGSDIFALGRGNGLDTITDFSLGQGDKIGLLDGLTFNQLSFSGNQIRAGNQVLAVVNELNTNTLTAANFVTVSESFF